MPFEYIEFEEGRKRSGLRMVVVSGVPSPWGEAAKGIFHMKQIPWSAIRLDPGDDEMAAWAGGRSGPAAIYEDESPRSGWAEILFLAERLEKAPSLIPGDAGERAEMLGLCHEICGEEGLGWTRRLQSVHEGLQGRPGFPLPVARYLADKYGYREADALGYRARIIELLGLLTNRLRRQRDAGHDFYFGDQASAVDVYSATFMALFSPLPAEQCAMPDALRVGFEQTDEVVARALAPLLLAHRDMMYAKHLDLPLSL